MNWQSHGVCVCVGWAVQSEIGLMLPITALGLCSKEEDEPYKGTSDFFLKVKAVGMN